MRCTAAVCCVVLSASMVIDLLGQLVPTPLKPMGRSEEAKRDWLEVSAEINWAGAKVETRIMYVTDDIETEDPGGIAEPLPRSKVRLSNDTKEVKIPIEVTLWNKGDRPVFVVADTNFVFASIYRVYCYDRQTNKKAWLSRRAAKWNEEDWAQPYILLDSKSNPTPNLLYPALSGWSAGPSPWIGKNRTTLRFTLPMQFDSDVPWPDIEKSQPSAATIVTGELPRNTHVFQVMFPLMVEYIPFGEASRYQRRCAFVFRGIRE